MIFDAHTHVFRELRGAVAAGAVTALSYGRVRRGQEAIQLLPPVCPTTAFPPEALLAHLDWAGVEKAMLLQGPFYGNQNREVLDALRRHPDRLVGAAYLDPWMPGARAEFDAMVAERDFSAVKLEFSEPTGLCGLHPEARLDDPQVAWLWPELQSHDLVLVLDLGTAGSRSFQTGAVRGIAESHPGLKTVIPHLGQIRPEVVADGARRRMWEEQIDLGCLPNVWFDCAALPAYLPDEEYPYPTVGAFLRRAIDRIGPQKVLWGTDSPGLLSLLTYPQLLALGRLHTAFLTADAQEMVLGGNAAGVYIGRRAGGGPRPAAVPRSRGSDAPARPGQGGGP